MTTANPKSIASAILRARGKPGYDALIRTTFAAPPKTTRGGKLRLAKK